MDWGPFSCPQNIVFWAAPRDEEPCADEVTASPLSTT